LRITRYRLVVAVGVLPCLGDGLAEDATVNGKRVNVMVSSGRVGVVFVRRPPACGADAQRPEGWQTLYRGPSLRDGLRLALQKYQGREVQVGQATYRLQASITHGSVGLTPDLHFQVNEVVVNALQDREAFAMAEQFFQTGEGRPLLDWLQERSEEVAAEEERVRRLAAR
jgi:hypothetical protein